MESLPLEVIRYLYSYLSPDDRFSCLFVCRQFLAAAIVRSLPNTETIRFRLSNCPCHGQISEKETCFTLCTCGGHGAVEVLDSVLPHIIFATRSLELEDELTKTRISDENLYMLLARCVDAPLKRLSMSNCDLAQVRPWTMGLLAKFDKLKEFSLDGCSLPLTETQLIRSISPSFQTLTTVEIKNSSLITDKLASRLSKHCPLLDTYKVSGCISVTAFSALAFIEAAVLRSKPVLNMFVENTAFDAQHLVRYISSPLFAARGDWRIRGTHLPLGYDKYAILAEHRNQRCVVICV